MSDFRFQDSASRLCGSLLVVLVASCNQLPNVEVSPWIASAMPALKETSIVKEPPADQWKWWKLLGKLDSFASLKAVIDPLVHLGKLSFSLKAGAAKSCDMNKHLQTLAAATAKWKD